MEYGALIGLVTEEPRSPRSNTVFELVNDVSAALKADMVRRSQMPSSFSGWTSTTNGRRWRSVSS